MPLAGILPRRRRGQRASYPGAGGASGHLTRAPEGPAGILPGRRRGQRASYPGAGGASGHVTRAPKGPAGILPGRRRGQRASYPGAGGASGHLTRAPEGPAGVWLAFTMVRSERTTIMDFELPEEHQIAYESAFAFARDEIRPHNAEIERSDDFPSWLWKRLADQGYTGIAIPEEYGGSGGDFLMA